MYSWACNKTNGPWMQHVVQMSGKGGFLDAYTPSQGHFFMRGDKYDNVPCQEAWNAIELYYGKCSIQSICSWTIIDVWLKICICCIFQPSFQILWKCNYKLCSAASWSILSGKFMKSSSCDDKTLQLHSQTAKIRCDLFLSPDLKKIFQN